MTAGFLLIVQIVLVVMLVIAVLLQKSSSIGLGAYSGSNESVFGAKGPASFLAKTTFTIGFLFVINTLALGYIYASNAAESVVDNIVEKTNITAPVTPLPATTKVEAPIAAAPTTQEQNSSTEANSTTQK